jgi:hypothetical protein
VPAALSGAVARGVLWQAAPGRFLLDVPQTARYLVEQGRRICIDSCPSAPEVDVVRFSRMTPLAALFFQRGMLALHAGAVVGAGGAVLIGGDSGSGKSTLIAALLKRGWKLLADDLAAVDVDENDTPLVNPAFPDMRLWSDSMHMLQIENNAEERSVLITEDRFTASPQPLKAIFHLAINNSDSVGSSRVKGAIIFSALTTLSYNTHVADVLLDRAAYMRRASAIARTVPFISVLRPRGRWNLDELADIVEKECP